MRDRLKVQFAKANGLTGFQPAVNDIQICRHIDRHNIDLLKMLLRYDFFFAHGSGGRETTRGSVLGFFGSCGVLTGISCKESAGQSGAAGLHRLKIPEIRAADGPGISERLTGVLVTPVVVKNPFQSAGEGQSSHF